MKSEKYWWKYYLQLSWQPQSITDQVEAGPASNSLDNSRTHGVLCKQPRLPFHTKSPMMQSEWQAILKDDTTFPHVVLVLPTKALSTNNTGFVIFVCFDPQVGR